MNKNRNEVNGESLSKILNLINSPAVVISSSGYVFASNKLFEKYLGIKTEELSGTNLFEQGFWEKIESRSKEDIKLRENKNEVYEVGLMSRSGKVTLFEAKTEKMAYEGQMLELIVLNEAIEEHTQNELQENFVRKYPENKVSEDRFYKIASSIKDALIVINPESKVTYWNPAAEKTFGYTMDETIGKKIHELVVPKSMPKEGKNSIKESLKTFSETGIGYFTVGNVEVVGRRKDGSEFPAELSISPVNLDEQWSAIGVVKDISNRKKAEQKLRDAEQRYHALFNQSPLGIIVVDPADASLVEFNETAHIQLGYSYEEFEATKIFDIEAKETPEEIETHLIEIVKSGEAEFETQQKTKDGKIRNVIVTTRVFKSAGKTFLYCILHDVTESRKLQDKLGEYSQKLEELVQKRTDELKKTQAELVKSERLAAIGELAGMIGHDLRNPLSGIKNSVYFMKKRGTELQPNQAQEMFEIIEKCVDYSNRIINDLLDYSRELTLDLENISLKKVLNDAVLMVSIPEKIKVENKLEDTIVLKADPSKFKRVFINLIKNSVDAMPSGGKITVESKELKSSVEISFIDTGTGISDNIMPKLFSPLFTTKAKGMGFGLAICKRIIEAHGGIIKVKTEKGKGTKFTLTVPIENSIENGGEKAWIRNQEFSLSTTMKLSEQL